MRSRREHLAKRQDAAALPATLTDGDGAGGSAAAPRPVIPWSTDLGIRLDVACHRSPPLAVMGITLLMLGAIVPSAMLAIFLGTFSRGLGALAMILSGPLMAGLVIWVYTRLNDRSNGRRATPAEVHALRRHARSGTWAYVQGRAARTCDASPVTPVTPVTIAMILRWQDEAVVEQRNTLPRQVAEQAAVRAQARAFE